MTDRRCSRAAPILVAGGVLAGAGWWIARSRRHLDLRNRVVLITGGSRGLGLHLARQFAAQGARLALIARDDEELKRARQELHRRGAVALTVATDVTKRENVNAAIEEVVQQYQRLDVLVNNAGVIQAGPLEHMAEEDFQASLAVHVLAPLYAAVAALPHFKRQGGGRIINISSIGGKVALPHLLPYCTGKFGLSGLSDGLRVELRRYGVYVTTVCPGLMRTGSPTQAVFKGRYEREYAWFVTGDVMPGLSVSAQAAATRIVEACKAGEARVIIGVPAKLAAAGNALCPELTTKLLSLANRLLPKPLTSATTRGVTGWESRGRAPRVGRTTP